MQKIGIITFHRASNYGAVLQAFALQSVLNGLGADAEIVDYHGKVVEENHNPSKVLSRCSVPVAPLRYYQRRNKFRVFEEFRKAHLPMSEMVTSSDVGKLDGRYDLFLTGSDQVWSKEWSGLDSTYRLDFVKESRKSSYACSFGFSSFPEGSKQIFSESLSELENVSVRELSAKRLIEDELGISARVDLDPTLLVNTTQWSEISITPPVQDGYILIYSMLPPKSLLEAARAKARETGLDVIFLSNSYKSNRDLKKVRYSTPEEFLGWFKNASYVFTNSFHGTVFSIIFERNLVVECQSLTRYNIRSKDLLKLAGLEEREMVDGCFNEETIDWELVNCNLNEARNNSICYLRNLCNAQNEEEK